MAEITIIPAKERSSEIVRTAVYTRVSSDSEDQLNSFAAQIRYYTELLQNSADTVFVDLYADEGVTGTSAVKRADFQRLMSDCRKGKIDRVLTKSVSRFARNTTECLAAVRELKTLGISVYFEKEDIDESMSIAKNVRIGVHKRMADGSYKNPSVPYGYVYKNGEMFIDDDKAQIVNRIFEWYSTGIGIEEIAFRLDSEKISAPNSNHWRVKSVRQILRNERYIGDKLFQKTFKSDTLPFKPVVNIGQKLQYYVSNTHPPIISRELFDKVQTLMSERTTPYSPRQSYLFSGKIRCVCGGKFRRKICNNKIYWVCLNHDHKSLTECSIRQIGEWIFQNAFIWLWNKLQAHYKTVLVPMLRQLETLSEKEKSGNTQIAALRKVIADIKQQIHLMTVLNSQGTLDGAYFKERAQELDRKLLTTQRQLHASLDDKDTERLDDLRKLIGILEKAEQIAEFDEIKFGQIVEKITVLSETQIRFDLIGGIGFSEQIAR